MREKTTPMAWRKEAPFGTNIVATPRGTIATMSPGSRLRHDDEFIIAHVNAAPLHEELWKAAEEWCSDCCAGWTNLSGPNIGEIACPEGGERCDTYRAVEALRYLHGKDTTAHEHEWELAYIDTGGEHYRCRDCGASSTALPIPPTRPQRGIVEDTTGGESE